MSDLPKRHRGAPSVEFFDNRETEYLAWVQAHPAGYVANVDRLAAVPQYPMLHRASHAAVSSNKIGNFTKGDYVKYCSTDLDALRAWVEATCGRAATICAQCL